MLPCCVMAAHKRREKPVMYHQPQPLALALALDCTPRYAGALTEAVVSLRFPEKEEGHPWVRHIDSIRNGAGKVKMSQSHPCAPRAGPVIRRRATNSPAGSAGASLVCSPLEGITAITAVSASIRATSMIGLPVID